MFGLSLKDRAAEALRRGTKAALIGGFFHVTEAAKFGLNHDASAHLYTEAQAHQIYALGFIFRDALARTKAWATPVFAKKAIIEAMTDFEHEMGFTAGAISSYVFRRCAEIDELSPQERLDGKQFAQSADRVAELDPRADKSVIANVLENATRKYFDQVAQMFAT